MDLRIIRPETVISEKGIINCTGLEDASKDLGT